MYSISPHYFSILKKYFIHPWFNNIFDYMILNVSFFKEDKTVKEKLFRPCTFLPVFVVRLLQGAAGRMFFPPVSISGRAQMDSSSKRTGVRTCCTNAPV